MKVKYTITQFKTEFSDENTCLEKVFNLVHGQNEPCPKCKRKRGFKRVKTRRCFQCPICYYQIYPTKNTIFEKSTTPLTTWFYAMFLVSASKNGLSACELQRQTGVTYKTAFRMLHQIRTLMGSSDRMFSGIVELDETFVGGKNINRHTNKKVQYSPGGGFIDKSVVFGIYHHNSKTVKGFVVPNTKGATLKPLIHTNITEGSQVMTDEHGGYYGLDENYNHTTVFHNRKQYANGKTTTNRIENFWSIFKRTIKGSYVQVSPKYLQAYVNEATFKFNNRNNGQIFNELINRIERS